VNKELSDAEIKHIRRREYYNRRVRTDFAPPKLESEIPDIIKRLDNPDDEPLTPETRKREEQRLDYLVRLKTQKDQYQTAKPLYR
jgi:hypothetical protein